MDLSSLNPLAKKKDAGTLKEEFLSSARRIHEESVIVDGHIGTLLDVLHKTRPFHELASWGHADLPRLEAGGVKCAIMSAFPIDRNYPIRGVHTGLAYVDAFLSLPSSDRIVLPANTGELEEAAREGKTSLFLSFEGGEFLDGSVASLRMYRKLGLRCLTLVWNERNALADGAAEYATKGGLTRFGHQVVSECEEQGILVDVANLSEAGFWDVVDMASQPLVASHSNCQALYPHPHNLTDDQMRAIAETGGLVAVTLNPEFLSGPEESPSLSLVCDHITHALDVAGEDSVGIGSDFDSFQDGAPEPVTGIDKLPLLTAELLERGLDEKVVARVLGGNWLRVMRAVFG